MNPARAHRRWTPEEVTGLLTGIRAGTPIPEIATLLSRTENAILFRLRSMIHTRVRTQGETPEAVAEDLHLSPETVAEHLTLADQDANRKALADKARDLKTQAKAKGRGRFNRDRLVTETKTLKTQNDHLAQMIRRNDLLLKRLDQLHKIRALRPSWPDEMTLVHGELIRKTEAHLDRELLLQSTGT